MNNDCGGLEIETLEVDELSSAQRTLISELFEASYRQANHAYLEKSLGTLRFVSLAMRDGELAGFALGEPRMMEVPRLPRQVVGLAGLACVLPEFRRHGLFMELAKRALLANRAPQSVPLLTGGRIAHAGAFRTMSRNPTVVPKRGVAPTPWQQEIGQAVADAYGVEAFDPETFVCRGSGKPIGYPVIELEVAPEEEELFRHVNRDRGDSLLGIAWSPTAPPGWDD